MSLDQEIIKLEAVIPIESGWEGLRLDQALAKLFPEHSRSRIKIWIEEGKVWVNGGVVTKPREKVQGGSQVVIETAVEVQTEWSGEDIPLEIIYQDQDILVINKPANMVVHPGIKNQTGTLVNALLHYCPELKQIPRAGIVHRLDKDTTGVLVVAKTLQAHTDLVTKLQKRKVKRVYMALVWGNVLSGGTIATQMGRHPVDHSKMAVVESGKEAVTHYRVLQRFQTHTLLEVSLETGRTHQIRVHMAHLNHPVVGDQTYGGRTRIPPKASKLILESLNNFKRQALHAKQLAFAHPVTKEEMSFEAPVPEDLEKLLKVLAID